MKTDEFDSIIFDCDGVLIDVTKSYDTTINKTISYVLKEIADITVDAPLTNEILLKFKSTGGFNDEIDITYSGILCFIAAKKLNKDPTELILDVLNNADDTGITYIEDFLNKIDMDISDVKARLAYPSTDKNDLIHATFDQLFFGPELYIKIFQKKSKQVSSVFSLIKKERERVIKNLRSYNIFNVFDSKANYVLFDAKGSDSRVYNALAEQGISIRKLGKLGKHRGCLRVTIGTKEMNSKFLLAIRDLVR